MTRQRDIEFSDLVRERCPMMHEAIRQVGHRQTRNRGTLGGSLCHLDPSAELVSLAAALDAKVSVAGTNGSRSIDFAAFPVAYMTPAIELDELVTGATFPCWPRRSRLRLRRVLPPAWRFRHRVGGGADRGGQQRQGDARLGDARRHGAGAGAGERSRAGAHRRDHRGKAAARDLRNACASSTPSKTSTRRHLTASNWRRCCRAAR